MLTPTLIPYSPDKEKKDAKNVQRIQAEWDLKYSTQSTLDELHSRNFAISRDFLIHVINRSPQKPGFLNVLRKAKTMLEVAAGTGQFIIEMGVNFHQLRQAEGIDISKQAIASAVLNANNQKNAGRFDGRKTDFSMKFNQANILAAAGANYDLVVASQYVQLYRSPPDLIMNHLLKLGRYLLVIAPYKEGLPVDELEFYDSDDDSDEAHKVVIDESTFSGLDVIEEMVFFSRDGWGTQHEGECPLLYACLIESPYFNEIPSIQLLENISAGEEKQRHPTYTSQLTLTIPDSAKAQLESEKKSSE